jgi:WD40 repeat protein
VTPLLLVVFYVNGLREAEVQARRDAMAAKTAAERQRDEAQRQARIATIHNLAIQSLAANKSAELRALLAAEAATRAPSPREPHLAAAEQALRQVIGAVGGRFLVDADQVSGNDFGMDNERHHLVAGVSHRDTRFLAVYNLDAPDPLSTMRAVAIGLGHPVDTHRAIDLDNVSVSRDGRTILVAAIRPADALLWRASASAESKLRRLEVGVDECYAATVSPNGRWAVLGTRLLDLSHNAPRIRELAPKQSSSFSEVAFDPTGRWVATARDEVQLRDLHDPQVPLKPVVALAIQRGSGRIIRPSNSHLPFAFSADGRRFVAWSNTPPHTFNGTSAKRWPMLRAWDLTSPGPPRQLIDWEGTLSMDGSSPEGGVISATFSSDGRWLAAGTENGMLGLWDLAASGKGNPVMLPTAAQRRPEQRPRVTSVAFSNNGRWFAAGLADGTVGLWSVQALGPSAAAASLLTFAVSSVHTIAFSPDSRWLAAGGLSRPTGIPSRAGVWDLADPEPSASVTVLGDDVNFAFDTITFSSNSRWLIAFNNEPLLASLWPLQFDDLLAAAKRVAGRNMTKTEWRTALPGEEAYHATFSDLPTP